METFASIQGEGAFTGHAAWFIRLGGCDVGCSWCDVKESWDTNVHPVREVDELVSEALGQPARIAIVTGGEPLMHDLGPLTDALIAAGFRTHIETSGTHPLSGTWHWICLSPKKFKEPVPGTHERADELKVIVYHRSDLDWAEGHAARVRPTCRLFLQPEWSKRAAMSPLIVARITGDPRWQISMQTHKYLDIP
ncbi:MAG: radical SAM protein [Flavobacteriales bacterium]|nr:radical SAM protein [Flavobacteriales bacterium]